MAMDGVYITVKRAILPSASQSKSSEAQYNLRPDVLDVLWIDYYDELITKLLKG
jgi:hypothetical protein